MDLNNRFLSVLERFRSDRESDSPLHSFPGSLGLHNYFIYFQRAREAAWPEVLSYYCSSSVAESIVGKGKIWLNDVRKMNDETEMTFAVERIGNELSRIENSAHSDLHAVISDSYSGLTDSSIWKNSITYNNKLILAMCFTQAEDDAAMWDRYGDSGKGVSIHFNLKKLSVAITTAGHFFPNTLVFEHGVVEICYGVGGCVCVDELHQDALEAYASAKTKDERDLLRTMLHANVLELLVSHKHISFSSEREFRIFSRASSEKTWSGTDHIFEHNQGNRKSIHSEIFLPHQAINQSEEEFWKELIVGVTIGPCSSGETKDMMQSALESRGIVDRIISSTCPLRNPEE